MVLRAGDFVPYGSERQSRRVQCMGLRILLTGTEGWGVDQVASMLRAEGHVLLSCNDQDDLIAV